MSNSYEVPETLLYEQNWLQTCLWSSDLLLFPLTCAYVLHSIAVMAFRSSSWDLAGILGKLFGLTAWFSFLAKVLAVGLNSKLN